MLDFFFKLGDMVMMIVGVGGGLDVFINIWFKYDLMVKYIV